MKRKASTPGTKSKHAKTDKLVTELIEALKECGRRQMEKRKPILDRKLQLEALTVTNISTPSSHTVDYYQVDTDFIAEVTTTPDPVYMWCSSTTVNLYSTQNNQINRVQRTGLDEAEGIYSVQACGSDSILFIVGRPYNEFLMEREVTAERTTGAVSIKIYNHKTMNVTHEITLRKNIQKLTYLNDKYILAAGPEVLLFLLVDKKIKVVKELDMAGGEAKLCNVMILPDGLFIVTEKQVMLYYINKPTMLLSYQGKKYFMPTIEMISRDEVALVYYKGHRWHYSCAYDYAIDIVNFHAMRIVSTIDIGRQTGHYKGELICLANSVVGTAMDTTLAVFDLQDLAIKKMEFGILQITANTAEQRTDKLVWANEYQFVAKTLWNCHHLCTIPVSAFQFKKENEERMLRCAQNEQFCDIYVLIRQN
jgi:hypothetical protein